MDAVFEAQGLDGILLMNQCRSQYWEGGVQARCTMDVHSPTTGEGQLACTSTGVHDFKIQYNHHIDPTISDLLRHTCGSVLCRILAIRSFVKKGSGDSVRESMGSLLGGKESTQFWDMILFAFAAHSWAHPLGNHDRLIQKQLWIFIVPQQKAKWPVPALGFRASKFTPPIT